MTPSDCKRCDNGRVQSLTLGRRIRCPFCRVLRAKTSKQTRAATASVGQEISTPESLRMARILAGICAQVELERWKFPGLPSHLVGTDRVMQRWAAASSGMLSDDPDLYFKARSPPLDDKTQEKVSDILRAASAGIRQFVWDWYKTQTPTDVLAQERHMSRRQLIREWQDVLVFLRQQFALSHHADLVVLVRQLA